jgi:hypothetical protein
MPSTRWSVLVSLVVVLTAWQAHATVLKSPIITAPGLWELDKKWQQGIIIRASNVILDCHGHTIEGPNSPEVPGRGIFAQNVNHVIIKDCEVTNWNVGISLNGGSKHQLLGVRAHENFFGIALTQTTEVDLLANAAQQPPNPSGIWTNNHGLYLTRTTSTKIQDAQLTDNRLTGISMVDGVSDVLIERSHIANNGRVRRDTPHLAGVYLHVSTHAVLIRDSFFGSNGPADAICSQRACHIVQDCRTQPPVLDNLTFNPGLNICDPEHACSRDGVCPIF